MALALTTELLKENSFGRPAYEGKRILSRILEHIEQYGAKSSIILGQPESCKTAATCFLCEYFMNHFSQDVLFWRSALNAPIQIFKLPRWHIYVEKESGIHFFDRKTGKDITDKLKEKRKITYFKNFDDLIKKAKPGICNGIFFKDLHWKGIKKDEGTIRWFQFIRHLLHRIDWYHVFLEEYQEMVKAGNGEQMYYQIDRHGDDISSARKSNVGIYANAHQMTELDWRVSPGFMIIIQMYGSRLYKHSPVNKSALTSIPKPTELKGADAWISEGGHFGKVTFNKVYVLPDDFSIEARIIASEEKTKVCAKCNRVFIYKKIDQIYCSRSCQELSRRKRNKEKEL